MILLITLNRNKDDVINDIEISNIPQKQKYLEDIIYKEIPQFEYNDIFNQIKAEMYESM